MNRELNDWVNRHLARTETFIADLQQATVMDADIQRRLERLRDALADARRN